ncbi:MAG TPA: hypothetical protein PLO41_09505 [Rubrivivax sp.]|nr:hypothetical protein [Rubrivivax sp.]
MKRLFLLLAAAIVSAPALAGPPVGVSVSIGQPGWMGQIDIGPPVRVYAPPPVVLVPQPVYAPAPVVVHQPVYVRGAPPAPKYWRHPRHGVHGHYAHWHRPHGPQPWQRSGRHHDDRHDHGHGRHDR